MQNSKPSLCRKEDQFPCCGSHTVTSVNIEPTDLVTTLYALHQNVVLAGAFGILFLRSCMDGLDLTMILCTPFECRCQGVQHMKAVSDYTYMCITIP